MRRARARLRLWASVYFQQNTLSITFTTTRRVLAPAEKSKAELMSRGGLSKNRRSPAQIFEMLAIASASRVKIAVFGPLALIEDAIKLYT